MAKFKPLVALWQSSFLYPFKGIVFFLSHPAFWPLFRARLLPLTLLSAFILATLFLWAYLPQVALLSIYSGKAAWFNATMLVLGEGAAIVALLFEAFFVDETLVDVFDGVLVEKGLTDMVAQTRLVDSTAENSVKMLGKPSMSVVYSPFNLRQIVEFIVLLPINLIPVAGVPIFLVLTGYRAGPLHHWRYFKLLGLTRKERKEYVAKRKVRYMWFGTTALLLQLVPVLSMFFLLTTAAGSALWVAKIENSRRITLGTGTGQSVDGYTDDPV